MKFKDILEYSHTFIEETTIICIGLSFGINSLIGAASLNTAIPGVLITGLSIFNAVKTARNITSELMIADISKEAQEEIKKNNPKIKSFCTQEVKYAQALPEKERKLIKFLNRANLYQQLLGTLLIISTPIKTMDYSTPTATIPIFAGLGFFLSGVLTNFISEAVTNPASWYNKKKNKHNNELREPAEIIKNQVQQSLGNDTEIVNNNVIKQVAIQSQKQSVHAEQSNLFENNENMKDEPHGPSM